jgi:hypothetical protein
MVKLNLASIDFDDKKTSATVTIEAAGGSFADQITELSGFTGANAAIKFAVENGLVGVPSIRKVASPPFAVDVDGKEVTHANAQTSKIDRYRSMYVVAAGMA